MIESFRHKGLLPSQMIERIGIVMAALDVAKSIDDLNRPSFRLHPLKGELKGFWSIVVSANWRIVFCMKDNNVQEVDFLDYH